MALVIKFEVQIRPSFVIDQVEEKVHYCGGGFGKRNGDCRRWFVDDGLNIIEIPDTLGS